MLRHKSSRLFEAFYVCMEVGWQQCIFMIFSLTSWDLCHWSPFVLLMSLLIKLPEDTSGYPLTSHPFLCWYPHLFFFSPVPFIPGSGDLMESFVTIGDLFQSLCHRPLPFVRLQFTLWSSGCFLHYVLPASPDLITKVHFHIIFFCWLRVD